MAINERNWLARNSKQTWRKNKISCCFVWYTQKLCFFSDMSAGYLKNVLTRRQLSLTNRSRSEPMLSVKMNHIAETSYNIVWPYLLVKPMVHNSNFRSESGDQPSSQLEWLSLPTWCQPDGLLTLRMCYLLDHRCINHYTLKTDSTLLCFVSNFHGTQDFCGTLDFWQNMTIAYYWSLTTHLVLLVRMWTVWCRLEPDVLLAV